MVRFRSSSSSHCHQRRRLRHTAATPSNIILSAASIHVRDWQPSDVDQINRLLRSSQSSTSFDPEGPLELDVATEAAIRESYDPIDSGCFLVATTATSAMDQEDIIVGTAGFIAGTQVSYRKSGASVSENGITGAVRRVAVSLSFDDNDDFRISRAGVLNALLGKVEERAVVAEAHDLIVLAYPTSSNNNNNDNDITRPNERLLTDRGYKRLPTKLEGVDAVHYRKVISSSTPDDGSSTSAQVLSTALNRNSESGSVVGNIRNVAIVTILAGCLFLVIVGGVANIMGLEVIPITDGSNRGIGSPLSIQELERLRQDERLQRVDLDGVDSSSSSISNAQPNGNTERQWSDLTLEERREESALMDIIQGKDVRIK